MKMIRILSLLAVVSGILFTVLAMCQQATAQPFTLEITSNLEEGHSNRWDFANTTDKDIRSGSMVVVAIRKINRSDHEIPRRSFDGGVYRYEVRDSSGNLLKPKRAGQQNFISRNPGLLRGSKDTVLQPGQIIVASAPLGDWFDMSEPGTYTLQASEHVSDDPDSQVIKSNTITIHVLPLNN